MANNIALSAGVRANLQSLRGTAEMLAAAQGRLSTGKKVNSALDNPLSYFTAKGLNDKANGLNSLLDGISNGIQTVKAADKGLTAIRAALDTMKGLVNQAKADAGTRSNTSAGSKTVTESDQLASAGIGVADNDTLTLTDSVTGGVTTINVGTVGTKNVSDLISMISTQSNGAYTARVSDGKLQVSSTTGNGFDVGGDVQAALGLATSSAATGTVNQEKLNSYAKQFNDVAKSITQLAADSGFNGVNLLDKANQLTVNFNEDGSSSTSLDGNDVSLAALGLSTPLSTTASTVADFTSKITTLETAANKVGTMNAEVSSKLSIMQNRQDFSKGLIDILKVGADNLVNADQNEEAANVLALQTRQQLSQTALSMANQADQAVLRLF